MKLPPRWFGRNRIWLRLEQLEDRNAPSDSLSAILQAACLSNAAVDFAAAQTAPAGDFTTAEDPLAAVSLSSSSPATTDLTEWLPANDSGRTPSAQTDLDRPAANGLSFDQRPADALFANWIDSSIDRSDLSASLDGQSAGPSFVAPGNNVPAPQPAGAATPGGAQTGATNANPTSASPSFSPSTSSNFTPPFIPTSGNGGGNGNPGQGVNNFFGPPKPSSNSPDSPTAPTDSVFFSASSYQAYEDQGSISITVSRTGTLAGQESVDFFTSNGTATSGVDYVATQGTLTFNSGDTQKTFTIQILNDGQTDGPETVTLTLTNPQGGASIGSQNSATLTINDVPPPTFQFASDVYSAYEDDGAATITVTRSGDTSQLDTVEYGTVGETGVAGVDYTSVDGLLTFNPGVTQQVFMVPLLNDGNPDGTEMVGLTLTNPSEGTIGQPAPAELDISDPTPGIVYFDQSNFTVDETTGAVMLQVDRSGDTSQAASVDFTAVNGTAVAGIDYTGTGGTFSFNEGGTSATFTLPVLSDTLGDGPESFSLFLNNPNYVQIGDPATATVTIVNPPPPVIEFDQFGYFVSENSGLATIQVDRRGDLRGASTVNFTTVDGTATAGMDYTFTNGTVTFQPGQNLQTFQVPITDDQRNDGDETVNLYLFNPTSASLGQTTISTLTIHDAQSAPPLAANEHFYTTVDQALGGIDLLDNATPADDRTMTAQLLSQPQNGSATLTSDGQFTYTPNDGYIGDETFTYSLTNTYGQSSTATITVSVTDVAPIAEDATFYVHSGQTLDLPQGLADYMEHGDSLSADLLPITAELGTAPSNGTLTEFLPDGSFQYVPNSGFAGDDSFTFFATDGVLSSAPATVTISVTNDPPIAGDVSYAVLASGSLTPTQTNLLANDYDPDGDPLQTVLVSGPQNAVSFQLFSNGTFQYTPAGGATIDSFTYEAFDGVAYSDPATVSISISGGVVARDDYYFVQPGTALTVSAADGILANDESLANPGATLSAIVTAYPPSDYGTFTPNNVAPDGSFDGAFTFTPGPNMPSEVVIPYLAYEGSQYGSAYIHIDTVQPGGNPFPSLKLQAVNFQRPAAYIITGDPKAGPKEGKRYAPDQWFDADGNGKIELPQDHAWPVAYVRDTTPVLGATFLVDPTSEAIMKWMNVDFKAQGGDVTFSGGQIIWGQGKIIVKNMQGSQAWAKTIKWLKDLKIDWSVQLYNILLAHVGESKNTIYVLYQKPVMPPAAPPNEAPLPLYLTFVDSGTRAADGFAGAAKDLPKQIFTDAFQPLKFMRAADPDAVPPDPYSQPTPLYYYKSWATTKIDPRSLLIRSDGECTAWAKMFLVVLKAQGRDYSSAGYQDVIHIEPISTKELMLVKSWNFPPAAPPVNNDPNRKNYPYLNLLDEGDWGAAGLFKATYGASTYKFANPSDVDGNTRKGLLGQNNNNLTLPLSIFGSHFIVQIDGVWYDPSYGAIYDLNTKKLDPMTQNLRLQALQDQALDGFAWNPNGTNKLYIRNIGMGGKLGLKLGTKGENY